VLDIIDARCQRPLIERHDAARHAVRRQARIAEHHRDDRDVYAGENVDRRAQGRADPKYQDQQRHDDEGIGTTERESDDANHCARHSFKNCPGAKFATLTVEG
jgi:hypothetical protein